jgi:hypothetical protein
VNEYPPKILVILFQAMVKLLNMSLIQKSQHLLLELAAAFAGNDLDQLYFPVQGLLHNAIQRRIDLIAAVVDVVQIQFEFGHGCALDVCKQNGDCRHRKLGGCFYLIPFVALCDEIRAAAHRQETGHHETIFEANGDIQGPG